MTPADILREYTVEDWVAVDGGRTRLCDLDTNAMAAEIARLRERDVLMTDAVRAFTDWLDHEDAGPQYNGHGRDTPEGQRIWQAWWGLSLSLCAEALDKGRAAMRPAP
jgi:hypothetical protein